MRVVTNNELYHYGVEGMHWGIRRYQNPDGTLTLAGKMHARKMDRQAKKDAKEYARAKMFYGEGAGTRRKLIKAKVNEKTKDHFYKSSFDKYLNSQNMEEHASKAKMERGARDAKNTAGVWARGSLHMILRDGAKVAAPVAAAWAIAHATGVDKQIASFAKTKMSDAVNGANEFKTRWKFQQNMKKWNR